MNDLYHPDEGAGSRGKDARPLGLRLPPGEAPPSPAESGWRDSVGCFLYLLGLLAVVALLLMSMLRGQQPGR